MAKLPIAFSDIKEKLTKELQNKLLECPIPNEKGFTLIEGFMKLEIREELSKEWGYAGPNVPVIGIVGGTSGRTYLFALKAVLPELDF